MCVVMEPYVTSEGLSLWQVLAVNEERVCVCVCVVMEQYATSEGLLLWQVLAVNEEGLCVCVCCDGAVCH